MATLIAYQDGNWTGATTWKAVATSTGAQQTAFGSSTATTTSYVYSPTFTITNGVVIEGVLMLTLRNNTSGTVSVALSDDNGVTATREVTVNASAIGDNYQWTFFKFSTPLTGDGGTDYRLGVKASIGSNVSFYRSATTADWSRYLRTDATASIGSSDVTFISPQLENSNITTNVTVTMDCTANTSYGPVTIANGCKLQYGTSNSTNYYLRLGGSLIVQYGGIFNIGTSGSRIPSDSTAVLEFNCTSNVEFGLILDNGGTCNIYGATRTNTKVLLTADANSGQKVVTVQDTTGWAANDEIAIASTTRTASQSEKLTVSTVDSGTQATMTANLAATHQGTAPYQGEVINLTRNVKIRGMSASLQSYVNCAATSSFTADHAEFYWLGSATASKRGISLAQTSSGTASISNCSIHDFSVTSSISVQMTGTTGSPAITECVFFAIAQTAIDMNVATSGTPIITNNWCVNNNAIGNTIYLADVGGTITGNRVVGGNIGFSIAEGATIGTFSNNIAHSASTTGFNINNNSIEGTIESCTAWRNLSGNVHGTTVNAPLTYSNFTSYHNTDSNIQLGRNVRVVNSTFNGGTGQSLSATTTEVAVFGTLSVLDNCTFGATNTAGSLLTVNLRAGQCTFINCSVAESTVFGSGQTNLVSPTSTPTIAFDKFNQTSGSHRAYKAYGYTASDQTTYRTAAPSEALIPNTAGSKLPSGSKKFAVANGTTATVTVYVNKSGTYNGNQPRLIVKRNIVGGITSDTVLATASGGTGSWLVLSGTTASVTDNCVLEVYVDCDGTAGTVYVDDWSVS